MAMRRVQFLSLAMLVVVAASRVAFAEIQVGESIEWMAEDSDVVARCRPVEIVDDGAVGATKRTRVTFEVGEAFKGTPTKRIVLHELDVVGLAELQRWQATGGERLVFFQRSDRPAREGEPDETDGTPAQYPLRLRFRAWELVDRHQTPVAYTLDFRVLHDPRQIDNAIRAAVACTLPPSVPAITPQGWWFEKAGIDPARPRAMHVEAAGEVQKELWGGSSVYLVVPFDARIEAVAFNWHAAGDRLRALSVLRFFRSDRALALFRAALADPSNRSDGYGGPAMRWSYPVRQLAYDTLRAWGIAGVARPAIDMPADGYRSVRPTRAVGLLLLPVALLATLAVAIVRRRSNAIRIVAVGALALGIVFVVGVWRDQDAVREVTISTASARYWAWIKHDGLTIVRAASWPDAHTFAYGPFDLGESPADRWGLLRLAKVNVWRHVGLERAAGTMQGSINTRTYSGPGAAVPCLSLTAPCWLIATALFALPAFIGTRDVRVGLRRRARRRRGRCPACGYDLRGGHARCPECGASSLIDSPKAEPDARGPNGHGRVGLPRTRHARDIPVPVLE